MIHTALTVLNWCHTAIPIEALAPLLQSPYLCSTEAEKNMGAQMDARLREHNKMHVSITDLFAVSQTVSRWRNLITFYQEKKSTTLSPSAWAQHFLALLKAVEWPSNRTQTSSEYQVLERFKKLLLEFSQLDFVFPTLNFRRALFLLNTLTQQTLFQPQSHHETIQIMGVLEASGILFDSLWVMGLHDGIWPPATKPHPLIPYAIQQQYQMPHATAKRELQFCEHMTQRLENAAKHVIFSSPSQDGDQLLFPSQLISHIPLLSREQLALSNESTFIEKITGKMETITDDRAPAIINFTPIHGGSAILKLQALCPFRAFATIRLKATGLKTPVIGIPAVTKGILIHHVLFALWGELKDQHALTALTDDALTDRINTQIDNTFAEHPYEMQQPHNQYFYQVEKKRLRMLIKQWLTFEKTRPYFRVVEREVECNVTINQLPIKIRLDRVDQLSDGSLFIIDYKTGLNSIAGWFQERLSDPQLPLYAAFQGSFDNKYAGISFAEIVNSKMKLKGVVREDHLYADEHFSGLMPIHRVKNEINVYSWDGLLQNWKLSLEKLSADFCDGDAIVDPLAPSVCLTCDLKSVCRMRH
jgi:probable DNA repair protein